MPLARSQSSARAMSAWNTVSSSASIMPQLPVPGPMPCAAGWASARWSICAEIRPTTRPSRSATKSCASAWPNHGFLLGRDEAVNLLLQRRHPIGIARVQAECDLDKGLAIRRSLDRPDGDVHVHLCGFFW